MTCTTFNFVSSKKEITRWNQFGRYYTINRTRRICTTGRGDNIINGGFLFFQFIQPPILYSPSKITIHLYNTYFYQTTVYHVVHYWIIVVNNNNNNNNITHYRRNRWPRRKKHTAAAAAKTTRHPPSVSHIDFFQWHIILYIRSSIHYYDISYDIHFYKTVSKDSRT